VPVAPDLVSTLPSIESASTAAEASVAALRAPFDCAGSVAKINILDVNPGSVHLKAEVAFVGEGTAKCGSLVWTSTPRGSEILPTRGTDKEVFLVGQAGRYTVTVNFERGTRRAVSAIVEVP
jgi:hypothetical protein